MSTTSTPENTEPGDDAPPPPPPPPPAADRPVVDGTQKTSEQLRAEMQQLLEEDRLREELTHDSGETVDRTGSRGGGSEPRQPTGAPPAGARAGRDDAVAAVVHQVDRVRAAVPERVSTVQTAVRQQPGLLAAVAGVLVLILLIARRLRAK